MVPYITRYEAHFRAIMEQRLKLSTNEAVKVQHKKLAKNERRLEELDRLFIRLYEDNVAGAFPTSDFP